MLKLIANLNLLQEILPNTARSNEKRRPCQEKS